MKRHGPWRIRSSAQVYRDPWIEVQKDDVVRPDGVEGTHCVVRMKPGVSVVPVDSSGYVYLTEEFHYGIGRDGIEAVSGGIEPGETAEATAHRELQEELGIEAASLTYLTTVDPFTTIVVSPTQLFLAGDLRFVPDAPEGTELIRRIRISLEEAIEWVCSGRIAHAPTCVLLLLAWKRSDKPV